MRLIDSQRSYRKWPKPAFCYLCGKVLDDGSDLDDDHCPPAGLFLQPDRSNYPIILRVHKRCNHAWHADDERLATTYAMLHGVLDPQDRRRRWPQLQEVSNDQGTFVGATQLPFVQFAFRIVRCAHALLYNEWLPTKTSNSVHIPLPEVDPGNANRPKPHLLQTYSFANALCSAQKTRTYDGLVAYGRRFKYVTTWTHADRGEPICFFTFDIYELHRLGIFIKDFPRAVIGSYRSATPRGAASLSPLVVENTDDEILYPILV